MKALGDLPLQPLDQHWPSQQEQQQQQQRQQQQHDLPHPLRRPLLRGHQAGHVHHGDAGAQVSRGI